MLDTSALPASARKPPGDERLQRALTAGPCHLSAVNLAELPAKFRDAGLAVERGLALVKALELIVDAADGRDAAESARLRAATRSAGPSLGDRACLALARRLGLPVLSLSSFGQRRSGTETASLLQQSTTCRGNSHASIERNPTRSPRLHRDGAERRQPDSA